MPLEVFDLVVERRPGKTAKTIRCIQRVMKRLRAPATPKILELAPEREAPIKHPLHPPVESRKR